MYKRFPISCAQVLKYPHSLADYCRNFFFLKKNIFRALGIGYTLTKLWPKAKMWFRVDFQHFRGVVGTLNIFFFKKKYYGINQQGYGDILR